MSLERAMAIGASGLTAQRIRMEVVTSNMTNASTTRTEEGGPYRRMRPIFVAQGVDDGIAPNLGPRLAGVRVLSVVGDPTPFPLRHEPGHPDADERGFVAYPNVDPVREMVDMLSATRSYEAQVTLVRGLRQMTQSALQILA